MDKWKKLAATLHVMAGALALLMTVMGMLDTGLVVGLILFGGEVVAGICYRRGLSKAKFALVGLSGLLLFSFPIGTGVGAYTLWAFWRGGSPSAQPNRFIRTAHTKAVIVILGVLALLISVFWVPTFSETSALTIDEDFSVLRLSKAGDVLLLRSKEHDYVFRVPANQLSSIFDSLPSDEAARPYCHLDELKVSAAGDARAKFEVYYYGGGEVKDGQVLTFLSAPERQRLSELGFQPTNRLDFRPETRPEAYMEWSRLVDGREAIASSPPDGKDLVGICTVPRYATREVASAIVIRNKLLNQILRPLAFLKQDVGGSLFLAFLLITGIRVGPGG